MRHRGFQDGVEARRGHTPEEAEYLGKVYRYRLEFYPDWESLIEEEKQLLASYPEIGPAYLAHIERMSKQREYRPAKALREMNAPTEAERVATLVQELEAHHQSPTLSQEEQRIAGDTARAIGVIQLTLFGQELLGGQEQQAACGCSCRQLH